MTHVYAHMQIVVALIVVKLFSFSNITRPHGLGIGSNLVQMNLTGLPELFTHHIPFKYSQEEEHIEFQNVRKSNKNNYY